MGFSTINSIHEGIGEVVPAREGLRLGKVLNYVFCVVLIGEVVPAREGLRLLLLLLSRVIVCLSEKWFQQEKD